jgi:hypothetical protein
MMGSFNMMIVIVFQLFGILATIAGGLYCVLETRKESTVNSTAADFKRRTNGRKGV